MRTGMTVFGWALMLLIATALFFGTADAVEVPWMQRMGSNGTGTVIATAWMTAPLLLLLLVVALVRFRGARPAVLLGWVVSLPLFAALYVAAYDFSYCPVPGC